MEVCEPGAGLEGVENERTALVSLAHHLRLRLTLDTDLGVSSCARSMHATLFKP